MELEEQLSNPSPALSRLVSSWRRLPAGAPTQSKGHPKLPQRVEARLGPERVAQLLTDYQAGVATTKLTKTYGLGKGTVLRLLETHGVARRRQTLTVDQVGEVIRLYGLGSSLARIADRFGRHHSVILRALDRAGVPRRDSHGRPQ